jgi:hypothetical protein
LERLVEDGDKLGLVAKLNSMMREPKLAGVAAPAAEPV